MYVISDNIFLYLLFRKMWNFKRDFTYIRIYRIFYCLIRTSCDYKAITYVLFCQAVNTWSSRLLLTFSLGGFRRSYFYRSYYLISVQKKKSQGKNF
jgi:hypothetical protein